MKKLREHRVAEEEHFRQLPLELLDITEMSALSAARAAGKGDNNAADFAAVKTARELLSTSRVFRATVKAGEGVRDNAPRIDAGEKLGEGYEEIDIAIDPVEGTNATANLAPNAVCASAGASKNGLMRVNDGYMMKLVVGPNVGDKVDINYPVEVNIDIIAKSLQRRVRDLTITVLDRERNEDLIKRIRATGARAQVIPDGDLVPGILCCMSGLSTHALMGIGASPEGIITAVGVRILRGHMQAKFWSRNDDESSKYFKMGINLDRVYTERDLAPGPNLALSITAVTALGTATKHILDGVSFFGGGATTHSLLLTYPTMKRMQKIKSTYVLDDEEFVTDNSEFRMY